MPVRKLDFICQHCQKTRLFTTASGPSICITPSDLLLSFKLKQTQHLKFGLLWGSWARQCHIESAVCDRLHLLRRSEASSLRIRSAVLRWTNMMAGCRRLCLSSSWPKRLGVVAFGLWSASDANTKLKSVMHGSRLCAGSSSFSEVVSSGKWKYFYVCAAHMAWTSWSDPQAESLSLVFQHISGSAGALTESLNVPQPWDLRDKDRGENYYFIM